MYMHMSHVLLHSFYSMVGIEGVVMTNDESERSWDVESVPSSYFLDARVPSPYRHFRGARDAGIFRRGINVARQFNDQIFGLQTIVKPWKWLWPVPDTVRYIDG